MPNRELMTWQAATHQVRKAKKPRKKSGVRTDRRAVKISDRRATVAWMSSSMSSTPSSSSSRPTGSTGAAVGSSAGVTPGVSSAPSTQEKSPVRMHDRIHRHLKLPFGKSFPKSNFPGCDTGETVSFFAIFTYPLMCFWPFTGKQQLSWMSAEVWLLLVPASVLLNAHIQLALM